MMAKAGRINIEVLYNPAISGREVRYRKNEVLECEILSMSHQQQWGQKALFIAQKENHKNKEKRKL